MEKNGWPALLGFKVCWKGLFWRGFFKEGRHYFSVLVVNIRACQKHSCQHSRKSLYVFQWTISMSEALMFLNAVCMMPLCLGVVSSSCYLELVHEYEVLSWNNLYYIKCKELASCRFFFCTAKSLQGRVRFLTGGNLDWKCFFSMPNQVHERKLMWWNSTSIVWMGVATRIEFAAGQSFYYGWALY